MNDDLRPDTAPTHTEDYRSRIFPPLRPAVDSMDLSEIEKAIREAPPNTAVEVPPEYVDRILAERQKTHGDFAHDAAVSQNLKQAMRNSANWNGLSAIQTEALEQIATKIGRILSGDPNNKDTWSDIQGYARLVEQRL